MKRFGYVCCLIVFALGAWGTAGAGTDDARESRRTPIVKVFEQCRDAVVNISTTRVVDMRSLGYGNPFDDVFNRGPLQRNRRVQSVGSGLIVHESGYIVTNAHVVSQASDVGVTFANNRTLPADVIAVDPEHDLAVIKVNSPEPLPALKLGRSDDIMIGETVVAIGNPLGLQHTVTRGIVSALNRDLQFDNDVVYPGLIQTDAPINPGNSGGPLLNINGELIGINTAIRGDAQNIGFAIPVDRLWELLPALLDIEHHQRVRFGLQVGGQDAKVLAVRQETPAAAAGLHEGDRVVAFNDQKLRDGIDYYVHLLAQKPGSDVHLKVQRAGTILDLTVPLQPVPIPNGAELAKSLLGMELEEIPTTWRRKRNLPDYVGLVVADVTRNRAADRAGIAPGDFLLRVGRVPVRTLEDVGRALEQVQPGERVFVEGLQIDARHMYFWTATLRAAGQS